MLAGKLTRSEADVAAEDTRGCRHATCKAEHAWGSCLKQESIGPHEPYRLHVKSQLPQVEVSIMHS